MIARKILSEAAKRLRPVSPSPFLDVEILLSFVLKKPREYVLAHPERLLTEAQRKKFIKLVARREKHEPIAYIIGYKEFYGLNFKVTPNTLIPRPETEALVENGLSAVSDIRNNDPDAKILVLDIGTGSGNIIIALATLLNKSGSSSNNNIFLSAFDNSPEALRVARANAKKITPGKKIKFVRSDLLDHFFEKPKSKISESFIILANLPYLSKKIFFAAPSDVKNFEPRPALLSAKHGLAHYEKLFMQIKKLMRNSRASNVYVFLEYSPEQKMKMSRLIKKHFFHPAFEFQKDLAGRWRIAKISLVRQRL